MTSAQRLTGFEDMADDAVGLLDALGLDRAHVVGASLGAMTAQTMAIRHPDRVHSLTSIMSTPGIGIGSPTPAAQLPLSVPPPTSRTEVVESTVAICKVISSPRYPMDEAWVREVAGQSYDHGFDPTGITRQRLAIYAFGDRTAALAHATTPALVVHGEADPLIQLPGGQATATALHDAELLVLPGMGHDLPRGIWPTLVAAISRLADRAEALPTTGGLCSSRKLHSCWRRELRLGALYLSHSTSLFGVRTAVTCRRAPIRWVAAGCGRRGTAGGVSRRLSRVRFRGKGCSRSPHRGRPLPLGCWQTRKVCPRPTVAVRGEVIS